MDWTTLFTNLGTFAIGSTALVILIKLLAPHLFSLNLERYKDELKAASDRSLEGYKAELKVRHEMEMERLRADLRQVTFQHEITFAKLHEKRAEIIVDLYQKLLKAEASARFLLTPLRYADDPPEEEREKQAESAANEFYRYYRDHKLYFDHHLCRLLEDLDTKLTVARVDHATYSEDDPETARERRAMRYLGWKALKEDFPPILREIEKEFRTLLGNVSPPRPAPES